MSPTGAPTARTRSSRATTSSRSGRPCGGSRAVDRARRHQRGRVPPAAARAGRARRRLDRAARSRTPRTPSPSSKLLAETAGSEVLDGADPAARQSPTRRRTSVAARSRSCATSSPPTGADTVICDGELTPGQLRNLEDMVKVKVIDRTALILDIFAQHAQEPRGQGAGRAGPAAVHAAAAARLGRQTCPARPVAGSARGRRHRRPRTR